MSNNRHTETAKERLSRAKQVEPTISDVHFVAFDIICKPAWKTNTGSVKTVMSPRNAVEVT